MVIGTPSKFKVTGLHSKLFAILTFNSNVTWNNFNRKPGHFIEVIMKMTTYIYYDYYKSIIMLSL